MAVWAFTVGAPHADLVERFVEFTRNGFLDWVIVPVFGVDQFEHWQIPDGFARL
jgi:hypothetical protein